MEPKWFSSHHLVRRKHLNPHGTLYAGTSVEWFIDAGFIAVASMIDPEKIVCLKVHGMVFAQFISKGEIISYSSKVVFAGKTTLVAYIKVSLATGAKKKLYDGFVTFLSVDEFSNPANHGITIKPSNTEDKKLYEIASGL